MLVIGRKPGEHIVIDNNIIVRVVSYTNESGNSGLRLQIEAPREIEVWRGEIYDEKYGKKLPD